jgi:hypothetical protein
VPAAYLIEPFCMETEHTLRVHGRPGSDSGFTLKSPTAGDIVAATASGSPFVVSIGGRGRAAPKLVSDIAQAAAASRVPIYLAGPDADILGRAGRALSEASEGLLDVTGSTVVAAEPETSGNAMRRLIRDVEASGARLCLLAFDERSGTSLAAALDSEKCSASVMLVGGALTHIAKAAGRRSCHDGAWG